MRISFTVDDRQFRRAMRALQRRADHEIYLVARTLAAIGREYARDLITINIYATPERGGYKRTRYLLRSIYGAVEATRKVHVVTIGAAAEYAPYNELGWGQSAKSPEEIIQDARAYSAERARSQELIVLEYGEPREGLEPRPFILPALVMLERQLPSLVFDAYRRLGRGS